MLRHRAVFIERMCAWERRTCRPTHAYRASHTQIFRASACLTHNSLPQCLFCDKHTTPPNRHPNSDLTTSPRLPAKARHNPSRLAARQSPPNPHGGAGLPAAMLP